MRSARSCTAHGSRSRRATTSWACRITSVRSGHHPAHCRHRRGAKLNHRGSEVYPPSLARSSALCACGHEKCRSSSPNTASALRMTAFANGSSLPALRELKAAIDDGLPVIGYMHWSLLDNYEWGKSATTVHSGCSPSTERRSNGRPSQVLRCSAPSPAATASPNEKRGRNLMSTRLVVVHRLARRSHRRRVRRSSRHPA